MKKQKNVTFPGGEQAWQISYRKTIADLTNWAKKLPNEIRTKAVLFGSVSDEKLYKQSLLRRETGKKSNGCGYLHIAR